MGHCHKGPFALLRKIPAAVDLLTQLDISNLDTDDAVAFRDKVNDINKDLRDALNWVPFHALLYDIGIVLLLMVGFGFQLVPSQ